VPEIVCNEVTSIEVRLGELLSRNVGTHSSLPNSRAVLAEDELLRSRGKLWKTSDGEVFVVKIRIASNDLVGLS